jgi:hypothetical protein
MDAALRSRRGRIGEQHNAEQFASMSSASDRGSWCREGEDVRVGMVVEENEVLVRGREVVVCRTLTS